MEAVAEALAPAVGGASDGFARVSGRGSDFCALLGCGGLERAVSGGVRWAMRSRLEKGGLVGSVMCVFEGECLAVGKALSPAPLRTCNADCCLLTVKCHRRTGS